MTDVTVPSRCLIIMHCLHCSMRDAPTGFENVAVVKHAGLCAPLSTASRKYNYSSLSVLVNEYHFILLKCPSSFVQWIRQFSKAEKASGVW